MEYPTIKTHWLKDELTEYFTLNPSDIQAIDTIYRDKNLLGFAVLLKTYSLLGYPPRRKEDVPAAIVEWIAHQLRINSDVFKEYCWKDRLWNHHLSLIRRHTGFRPMGSDERSSLLEWLSERSNEFPSLKELSGAAMARCRECRVELPAESELRRLVHSARRIFFDTLCQTVSSRINSDIQKHLECLTAVSDSETSEYDWIKSPPGQLGLTTILEEIQKLKRIRAFSIDAAVHFSGYSPRILKNLRDRARGEKASQIRRHPPAIRYTLLAAVLRAREMEVTDNIVNIFLQLIRRIGKKADSALEQELVQDIRRVYGKSRILFRVAKAATENPDGTIREVIFPEVKEDVLLRLIEEFQKTETSYEASRAWQMKKKYNVHYRRMMKPVMDTLVFRTNNPAHRPLMAGVELVRRYLDTKHTYYPEEEAIPEEILTGVWRDMVLEEGPKGTKAVKKYFELCVLGKLERAIKCKEVWVDGAYRFRNPDEDLPADWGECRVEYYRRRGLPLEAAEFLDPLRNEMCAALDNFNRFLEKKGHDVSVHHPRGGERGFFHVPAIEKRPERTVLTQIKREVSDRWGILDLVDILLEADRRVHFSRFFQSSGQRQIMSKEELRERLLLAIFSLGTNLGFRRVHSAAKPPYSYDDLLYFKNRFITAEALREAAGALVNHILEIRNPHIWGAGTACASDGKHLGAWDQNLVAEWNPHYGKRGVMIYWHVVNNAICIYSQLKTCSSSEVAAMIEGLVRHDTEMRVESNFVDSHGQSEVAFAFCRLLGFELLPRLKRIKYEKLYLPDTGISNRFPHLAGVITRPIRWDIVAEQYDEIVRHVVAVAEDTGPIDSILRRFNSYNRTHPTYKAFTELGKALKTIFLCLYLTHPELREEIHEGLNIIESWNACNEFIFFGRKSEIQTNDPQMQELSVLCLQLLQNALILVNTLMVERVLYDTGMNRLMEPEDYRALTPLFTSNVNPYGDFELDIDKPSFLEAA